MRALVFTALLSFGLTVGAAASPHRIRLYPNPSMVVNSMAESPDGFLWLAAVDGLYRFDGFHFHKIPAFPLPSARFVGFTRDGSLWCAGLEGLVRFHQNRFDVIMRENVIAFLALPDEVYVR